MELLNTLRREGALRPSLLAFLTVLSALATVAVIATISVAAELAAQGTVSLRLAAVFIVSTLLYAVVQKVLMQRFAVHVERLIDTLRQSLFESIQQSDLNTVRTLGRARLFGVLTHTTQTISRNLPLLIIGTQQLVLVAFICLYLAFLSLTAFALSAVFCTVLVWVHLQRIQALGQATAQADRDEQALFDGLQGLLKGLKEVRMSAQRSEGIAAEIETIGSASATTRSALKAQWAHEFALIQVGFYVLVGLMVFVVPALSSEFNEVAFAGTMAALFLIGPVSTVATAIPAIDEAERAYQDLRDIQRSLRAAPAQPASAPTQTLELGALQHLELDDVRYRYPQATGESGFAVGPLNAEFKQGQISFLTGGNGAGKSTLMMLLTGLLNPNQGQLRLNGVAIDASQMQAWRNQIAAVFADYHLFTRLYGIEASALEKAQYWLERLDMADKVRIHQSSFTTTNLSTGQRKRLALISALLENKPVLILDEWAADQDPHFRTVFYEQILPELRADGKMIICVTHDDRWFEIADQLLHMEAGRLNLVRQRG